MPKENRKIVKLLTKMNEHYVIGEEVHGSRVGAISFRKDIHKTVGHSGMPCYVIRYVNSTVQTVVPHHDMAEYDTDVYDRQADEDVGSVPELPERDPGEQEVRDPEEMEAEE